MLKRKRAHSKKGKTKRGKVQLIILFVVIALGLVLAGGLFTNKGPRKSYSPITSFSLFCCNTGDGEACKPETGQDKELTYNNQQYGLLRTNVQFVEGNLHLKDSGQRLQNDPIILNSSDTHYPDGPRGVISGVLNQYCRKNLNDDMYFKKVPTQEELDKIMGRVPTFNLNEIIQLVQNNCTSTLNDQMVFVCKNNCFPVSCPANFSSTTCYGDETSVYDVYFKLSDYPSPGIPDFVKQCDKSVFDKLSITITPGEQELTNLPTGEFDRKNLHLNTFRVKEGVAELKVPWLSPFCKPAIYLYPEEKTNIHVQVSPVGNMSYTDPLYPKDGWKVTAYPNGRIDHNTVSYEYLYYEAEIPDDKVEKPKEGFVVKFDNLSNLLNNILPQLGLNKNESDEFSFYWLKVLPKSPYYFVGVVYQNNLDSIAPLVIDPKPDTIIRVALYFETLEDSLYNNVPQPQISTPLRSGFTVVEWGGIFKRDKDHPFSCFM